jgi:hypothetical protein
MIRENAIGLPSQDCRFFMSPRIRARQGQANAYFARTRLGGRQFADLQDFRRRALPVIPCRDHVSPLGRTSLAQADIQSASRSAATGALFNVPSTEAYSDDCYLG